VQTSYQLLADAILVLHLLIVVFIVGAVPVIWVGHFRKWNFVRNFAFRMTHLALIGFVAAESVFGMICPLTRWEDDLRIKAGGGAYGEKGFIAHWLQRLLFYDWDPRVFTAIYVAFFGLVLLTSLAVRPRRSTLWKQKGAAGKPG
jgi:hypothetical protein